MTCIYEVVLHMGDGCSWNADLSLAVCSTEEHATAVAVECIDAIQKSPYKTGSYGPNDVEVVKRDLDPDPTDVVRERLGEV